MMTQGWLFTAEAPPGGGGFTSLQSEFLLSHSPIWLAVVKTILPLVFNSASALWAAGSVNVLTCRGGGISFYFNR